MRMTLMLTDRLKTALALPVTALLILVPAVAAGAETCAPWNTRDFLSAAGADEIAACLEAGTPATARDAEGRTPLHWAAAYNPDPAASAALLAAGANPDARTLTGIAPLHMLAEAGGAPEVVELLAAAGAKLAPRSEELATPLAEAARRGHVEIVRTLLEAGVAPDDGEGTQIPLHVAAGHGRAGVVEVLLDYGADPALQNVLGSTALHDAVLGNHLEIVERLLAAGAPADIAYPGNETILHIAAAYSKDAGIIDALVAAGANPNARLKAESVIYDPEKAFGDTDFAVRPPPGSTPLHYAARLSRAPGVIDALLDNGARTDLLDNNGKTAWDLIAPREAMKAHEVYWRLNDLRFE